MKSKITPILLSLSLLGLVLFIYQLNSLPMIEVEMQSDRGEFGEILWRTGEAPYSQDRSRRFRIKRGEFRAYRIPIPEYGIDLFRLDPSNKKGKILISSLTVHRGLVSKTYDDPKE